MNTNNLLKLFFHISLVFTLICGLSHLVLMFTEFDEALGYFNIDAGSQKVLYIGMVAFYIFALIFSLLSRKTEAKKEVTVKPSRFTSFFSLLTGFLIGGEAIINVLKIFDGSFSYSHLRLIAIILAIPSCAYFIYMGINTEYNKTILKALSCSVIAWTACYVMEKYFAMDDYINAPMRVMNQMVLIIVMLYMVQESRIFFEIEQPVLFTTFSIIATNLLFTYSLSETVLTFCGIRAISYGTISHIAFLFLSLYSAGRLSDRLKKAENEN